MTRKALARCAIATLVGAGALAAAGAVAPSHAADDGELYVVQALPGRQVDVTIDGKTVAKAVKASAVAGPFKVNGGDRELTISSGGSTLSSGRVSVAGNSSSDVVVHLPRDPDDKPVMTVFRNDLSAVPQGKASLTVAHTAAVPPADIRVDGKVLFENVANGESLNLVVPVKTYKVAIVRAGKTDPVYLGPLSLTVKGGALNRVYAVGDPRKKTMNVALHVIETGNTGSGKPSTVNTGTGGQVADRSGSAQQTYVDLLQ